MALVALKAPLAEQPRGDAAGHRSHRHRAQHRAGHAQQRKRIRRENPPPDWVSIAFPRSTIRASLIAVSVAVSSRAPREL